MKISGKSGKFFKNYYKNPSRLNIGEPNFFLNIWFRRGQFLDKFRPLTHFSLQKGWF